MAWVQFTDSVSATSHNFIEVCTEPPCLCMVHQHGSQKLAKLTENLPFGFSVVHNITVSKILEIQLTLISDGKRCNCCQSPLFVAFKDGAYYCYFAYVLRISRYSGFLSVMLTSTGIFLRGLKLSGKSRS